MQNIILRVIITVILFCGGSYIYGQCNCANAGSTVYGEFKHSAAVFVGEVLEIKKLESVKDANYSEFDVTFKVKTAWKTDLSEILTIRNISENNDPSDFKEKESYLIYAWIYKNVLSSGIYCCSRTKLLNYAAKELEEFKERGEKPKNIIKISPENNGKPNKSMDVSAQQRRS
jgi:hypothetical protein